jgi:hypothetical protein
VQGKKLAKWAVVDEPSRHGKHVLKLVESKNRNAVYNLLLRDEKAPPTSPSRCACAPTPASRTAAAA